MTPQQRHIDEARKTLSTLVPFSEWCPPWEKAVHELAATIAATENRAAWDGWDAGCEYIDAIECGKSTTAKRIRLDLEAKYGPREVTNG